MAGSPAAVLLHLGPGLGNGLANLHNARRAGSGVVTVVGEHATGHQKYDAPLAVGHRGRRGFGIGVAAHQRDPRRRGPGRRRRRGRRPSGRIATLVLPADVSWSDGGLPVGARPRCPTVRAPTPPR